jgi:cytochrome c peroxidase
MKNRISVLIFVISLLTFSFTKPEKITKIDLGKKLFFDNILSENYTKNCASCHIPEFGFADTIAFSIGVHGRKGKRNAPAITDLTDRPLLFYDGRATSLEDQVHFPIEDFNEMNLPINEAVKRLNKSKIYRKLFAEVFNETPNRKNLELAIAAYERTLQTTNTKFDKFMNDDSTAITPSAQRGREIFMGTKAKCFDCHFSPDFTGDEFRNIGLYDAKKFTDEGRYTITKNKHDLGRFKVPGLRNVANTAPYMHNGMFKTLREVINYYDNPYKTVEQPINLDSLLEKPLHLTEQEKIDIESFLLSLSAIKK